VTEEHHSSSKKREVLAASNITVGYVEGIFCIVAEAEQYDVIIPLPGELAKELGAELINPSHVA
jgi:hypothetical protein